MTITVTPQATHQLDKFINHYTTREAPLEVMVSSVAISLVRISNKKWDHKQRLLGYTILM